ncbi:MAG: hypothetical protein CMK72_00955 [Pseudomonadaceae bacterium]|nr:hypothetical protein [Pseudomonadaceae bacterium]HCP54608.1 hypothetical protein [Pseudomonas sp.]
MKISFSPLSFPLSQKVSIYRVGDTLTIDGETFDFSLLPEGATLPLEAIFSEYFSGPVSREGNELYIALRLPIGPDASDRQRYPAIMHVTQDGPVEIPT